MANGIPVRHLVRIGSVAASNASILIANIGCAFQGISTFRVFLALGTSSVFSAFITDGTNTQQCDFERGASLPASAGLWYSFPALEGSAYGLNFKFPNNTSSTMTYTLIVDELRGEVV